MSADDYPGAGDAVARVAAWLAAADAAGEGAALRAELRELVAKRGAVPATPAGELPMRH